MGANSGGEGVIRPLLVLAVGILFAFVSSAIDASDRYRSPRNPERKIRTATKLIVLHTTEAPARSSLNKLSDRGEAHFCVTEEGQVYRIVDRDREAFHAGRSMWVGQEDVDKFSIGIECVGYHNKPMGMIQLRAIAALVKELKSMYHLSDDKVIAHSHVAYGAPNRWQKRKHRGRKRCGMLFAMPSVRRILGLSARPAIDVDVRAGRLVVGDPYLNKILYGGVDTMAANYAPPPPPPPKAVIAPARPKPSRAAVPAKTKPAARTVSGLTKNSKTESAAKSSPKTITKPATKPAAKTVARPFTKAVKKPVVKSASKPAKKTVSKPAAKTAPRSSVKKGTRVR